MNPMLKERPGKIPAAPLLLAGAAAAWLAVNPTGDFPLNDDWAFASPVRHLLQDNRLVLSDWTSPLAFPHLLTGFLLSKIFGFSHTVLRLSTLLWGVLAVYFLNRLLRDEGVSPAPRRLACGLLAFHPVAFVLSFTYHTDVPFLALALGAIYFYLRADRTGNARDEIFASLLACGAALTRQIGLMIPLSATLWSLWRSYRSAGSLTATFSSLRWGRLARFWAIPAFGVALFYAWFLHVHGPTWAHTVYVTQGTLRHAAHFLPFATETLKRTLDSLLYTALFAVAYFFIPAERSQRRSLGLDALFLAAAAALTVYLLRRGLFPYLENVYHPRGLGTMTVYEGNRWKPAFLWEQVWLWKTHTALAAVSLWALLRRHLPRRPTETEVKMLVFAVPLAAATLVGAKYFDRYLLEWHLVFLLFFSVRFQKTRVPLLAWGTLLIWAVVSVAGTQDYFAWNRAKWELGRVAARTLHLQPREIANGFDWNAHWKYESNMAELKKRKPLQEIGEWEWETMEPIRGVISYSPHLLPMEQRRMEKTYFSLLSPRGAVLYFYGRDRRPETP